MYCRTNISHHLEIKSLILFLALVFSSAHICAEEPHLLFKTGFDNVQITKSGSHRLVDANGLPGNNSLNYFNYVISSSNMPNYTDFVENKIVDTIGPNKQLGKALYIEFKKDDSSFVSKSRVQYIIRAINDLSDPVNRLDQGYVKQYMKIDWNSSDPSQWIDFMEWKSENEGFRFTCFIYDLDGTPYWQTIGQKKIDGSPHYYWSYSNHTTPVPRNTWFKFEVYWVADETNGIFKVAIDDVIIFDHVGKTRGETVPYYFMPFKAYGAQQQQHITDFEYWDKPPVLSVLSQEYQSASSPAEPDPVPNTGENYIITPGILELQ